MRYKCTLLILLLYYFSACTSSKHVVHSNNTAPLSHNKQAPRYTANKIIEYSKTFEGTKYKYGGTDRKGLDCSGLVYLAYQSQNIKIPRVSYAMATQGKAIALKNVIKGDLLFFKTTKSAKRINHVALVTQVQQGLISFIHATSSRGVIVSTLSQPYWKKAFVEARRML